MAESDENDPQWVLVEALFDRFVTSEGDSASAVGVGAYRCKCCDKQTIALAVFSGTHQIETGMTPEQGLAVASAIMAGLDRIGYKGAVN